MIILTTISVRAPDLLHIKDQDGTLRYGANQLWYNTRLQQRAGCCPTTAAHLLWYLSETKAKCRPLCQYKGEERTGFTNLMKEVWDYVTPGMMGVNSTAILTEGILNYGRVKEVGLSCRVLEIPRCLRLRPNCSEVRDFLEKAFRDDLLVAFLNLSNGSLKNLDNWHWVTLLSLDQDNLKALMYDQGKQDLLDLRQWLKTTTLGGGFVAAQPLK